MNNPIVEMRELRLGNTEACASPESTVKVRLENKAAGSREGGRRPFRAFQSLQSLSYEQPETVDAFQEHADAI